MDAAAEPTPLAEMALAEPVTLALRKANFDPLFPIQAIHCSLIALGQAKVIPLLLKCAEAATDPDSAYCAFLMKDASQFAI